MCACPRFTGPEGRRREVTCRTNSAAAMATLTDDAFFEPNRKAKKPAELSFLSAGVRATSLVSRVGYISDEHLAMRDSGLAQAPPPRTFPSSTL